MPLFSVAYIGLWAPCVGEECSDPNAVCLQGQCQCSRGYYESQGRCGMFNWHRFRMHDANYHTFCHFIPIILGIEVN